MRSHVALRHVRFRETGSLQDAIADDHRDRRVGRGAGRRARRHLLRAGRPRADPGPLDRRATGATSDYAGQQVYWRSIQQRATDLLTTYDYLWRWDTDWFWCSRAFGAQHPLVRRVWPRRLRRSDTYHRLVGLDRRFA